MYAAARRQEPMRPLQERGAHLVELDVTDDASMVAAAERIHAERGALDALVNSAGYGEYGALEDVPMERARYQLEVNVFGTARMIQLVLPAMRSRGCGRVVNVSSFGGKIGLPLGAWYHASKFAIEGMSDSLRGEVASFGIDVVVIEPGMTRSDFARVNYENLDRSSAGGPYADLARRTRALGMAGYEDGGVAVPADVIARVIVRALSARRPRTRYSPPFHSSAFLFLRWLLPDRALDAVIRAQTSAPWMVRRPGFRRRR